MTVGNQATAASVNGQLTSLAILLRNTCQQIHDLSTFINGQGNGLATLEAIGYSAGDAATAQSMISYLNTVAGVYFGTAAQASDFNFDQELSQLWAGG